MRDTIGAVRFSKIAPETLPTTKQGLCAVRVHGKCQSAVFELARLK